MSSSAIPDFSVPEASNRMSSMRSSQGRRSSLATLLEDCPICLDRMKCTDLGHPLQCKRHCGFNMCKTCIESLITSSKDDFQLASDGNMHVKVYLHCPNCRSDLSHSIRHTLLLRKVDELTSLKTSESEWTSSQVRLKKALHTTEVKKAIQHARIMEAEYFGFDEEDDDNMFFFDDDDDDDSDDDDDKSGLENYVGEEWGVEADLCNGVHTSFRVPRPPAPVIREEAIRVDPTLFAGLDSFLTEDERKEVTELMTRGKPSLLVDAAEILYNALQKLSTPKPSSLAAANRQTATDKRAHIRRRSLTRRSSVFQLIADAKIAQGRRNKEEKKVSEAMQALQNPRSRAAQHRQLEREMRIQAEFQKRFPLPVRMPKAVKLDLSLPFDMELVDYTWGGTVMDAYSKITVGFGNNITQRRPNNIHVGNILGTEPNPVKSAAVGCAIGLCVASDVNDGEYSDVYIGLPGQSRVLISHTGHIGKLGAVRGDVLTHIDGEAVAGKNATEVLEIINAKQSQEYIMLALNAEFSVADALKRRALVIAEM